MKVYVSVDMEGIAGIVLKEQLKRGEHLYEEARKILTNEVNAVVDALINEGVNEIIVKDAHGEGYNFLAEQLHPGATYCMGALKMDQRFPGLDASFDAAILIGYHAKGSEMNAIRDHTMTSEGWQYLTLNGRQIGEIGLDSLLFGLMDVPVIMVTGDDKTCAEARKELGNVATYETKTAYARHAGLIKPPKKVNSEIKLSIAEAIDNRTKYKPYKIEGPYEIMIRFLTTDQADSRYYDGVNNIRLNGLETLFKGDDLLQLLNRVM